MKGIPVRPNGDPLTLTFVVAGDYYQFGNWCRYSRVSPRSRYVRYLSRDHGAHQLRGCRDVDVVFTGTGRISDAADFMLKLIGVNQEYYQRESYHIEPNVVEC